MRRRAAALAVLVAGCGEDLAPPYLVDNLRILAVSAEPPEAAAGTEVALESLVVTPGDAAVDQAWLACVPPAGAQISTSPCPMETAMPLGAGASARVVLPEGTVQVVVTTVAALVSEGGLSACLSGFQEGGEVPAFCRIAVKRVNVVDAGAA